MLFIQRLSIFYWKNTRYPKYAHERNAIKFMKINPEPNKFGKVPKIGYDKMLDCEVLFQSVSFRHHQDKLIKYPAERFIQYGDEIFTEGKKDSFYNAHHLLHNLRIFKENDNYKVMFCDDGCFLNRSKRRGHNEAFHKKSSPFIHADKLNETAFLLKQGEYGRIIFNNRFINPDTGEWYYEHCVYNLISCDKSEFREKMFYRKNPDHEYKNLIYLR